MTQAHATLLRLKQAGADWNFQGWASTPDVDLHGDIVEPQGARFELPLPLLWMHSHSEPVGAVRDAHVSASGIRVTGRLTREVPRAREAWALMRDGALALSIGFEPEASEPLPLGGHRFTAWRFLELSLVSVPANPEARIGKGLVVGVGRGVESRAHPVLAPASAPRQPRKSATAPGFDAEMFGAAVGEAIAKSSRRLLLRIEALEKRLDGRA
jgi:HK97 family phage prohead protease